MCQTDSWQEAAALPGELSPALSDDLKGWDEGSEGGPGGRGYVYTYT